MTKATRASMTTASTSIASSGHGNRQAARGQGREPAWRRLERRMEQQHTAELISDFEDYDIGDGQPPRTPRKSKAGR